MHSNSGISEKHFGVVMTGNVGGRDGVLVYSFGSFLKCRVSCALKRNPRCSHRPTATTLSRYFVANTWVTFFLQKL